MDETKKSKKPKTKVERRRGGGLTPGFVVIIAEIKAIPKRVLSSTGKLWYGHVFGFGIAGCWESQTKHARMYEVSDRTVMRWSRTMEELGEILRLNLKGNWGCVWALRNPEVQKMKFLEHEGIKVRNPAYIGATSDEIPPTRVSGETRHVSRGRPDMGVYEPPTWVSGNYDKRKKSITAAEPLPADGQAQRLKKEELRLAERDTAIRGEFERRLPQREHGDLKEAGRRAVVYATMNPKVVELMSGGLKMAEAVEKVYDENKKLIDGENNRSRKGD